MPIVAFDYNFLLLFYSDLRGLDGTVVEICQQIIIAKKHKKKNVTKYPHRESRFR